MEDYRSKIREELKRDKGLQVFICGLLPPATKARVIELFDDYAKVELDGGSKKDNVRQYNVPFSLIILPEQGQ